MSCFEKLLASRGYHRTVVAFTFAPSPPQLDLRPLPFFLFSAPSAANVQALLPPHITNF